MRIGLTLYGSLDERSGGFRYDRKLVEGLRRNGDTVEVVELPWRRYPRGLLDNVSPRVHDRLRIDVDVMLQDELAHPSLVGLNRTLPYPIVSVVHHLRSSESRRLAPLYRAVEKRYLGSVDGVVCNSGPTRNVVTGLGVDPDRTVVAPPAGDRFDPEIDDETIERRGRSEPLRLVSVGSLTPRKGVRTLVGGVARAETDAELTVVGRPIDHDYLAAVRRDIRRYGLADRVRIAGELSDAALASVLESSHVLAMPSRYEGFGIVYLEGMSFGLPAIASRAGGAVETVEDGETGLLLDPDDPDAVADAIDRFGSDRDRLVAMGKNARRRYERHPNWAETTARVRRLLADTVGVAA